MVQRRQKTHRDTHRDGRRSSGGGARAAKPTKGLGFITALARNLNVVILFMLPFYGLPTVLIVFSGALTELHSRGPCGHTGSQEGLQAPKTHSHYHFLRPDMRYSTLVLRQGTAYRMCC